MEGIGEDWGGGYLEPWTTVMDGVVGKSVFHHHRNFSGQYTVGGGGGGTEIQG
jgi:hypothetical protein